MERKKEKILLQSMRRKQEQEEARQRKEREAEQRKEEERFKEEEKQRKKEEEKARRAVIFEQYKLKKAMEEAEKEVKSIFYPGFRLSFHPFSSVLCRVDPLICRTRWEEPNPGPRCAQRTTITTRAHLQGLALRRSTLSLERTTPADPWYPVGANADPAPI